MNKNRDYIEKSDLDNYFYYKYAYKKILLKIVYKYFHNQKTKEN